MTKELINELDTRRLVIQYDGINIGADITKGTPLSQALRCMADAQEDLEKRLDSGDFEEVEIDD